MKNKLFDKKKIFSLFILILPIIYIIKKVLNMPTSGIGLVDVIFNIILIVLIISIIVNIYLMSFKKEKFDGLIFANLLSIFTFLCICSSITFGNIHLYTLFGLSKNFNDAEYENKVVQIDSIDEDHIDENVPKNISNVVLYTKTTEDVHENIVSIYVCSSDKCIYKSSIIALDNEENPIVFKIANGYNIDHIIYDNLNGENNYLTKIEYNNKEVNRSMNRIDSKFIIIGLIITFLFVNAMYVISKHFLVKYVDKLKRMFGFKKIKLENIFLVVSILVGLVFSFLTPVNNIPDEPAHLQMIYEDIGLGRVYEDINENYYCETCAITKYNTTKPVDISEYKDISKIKLSDYSFSGFKPSISMVRHLPQTIGVLIGQLLHLPIFWIFVLGELFGVIVYSIGGYFVIKRIPIKKDIMFFIMLLPMAVQQYSSLSYDSFLNTCMFLFFTEFMRVKFTDAKIDFAFIFKILILLLIIAICKLPYVLISLLFFIIPLDKYSLNYKKIKIDIKKIVSNKYIMIPMILMFIFAVIVILPKIKYGRLIIACLLEPVKFVQLLFVTFKKLFAFYVVSAIAYFGWLTTPAPNNFILFVLIYCLFLMFFTKGKEDKKFSIKDSIILTLIFASIALLFFVVMIEWTCYVHNFEIGNTIEEFRRGLYLIKEEIEGVQGRYFICLLPLILFIPKRFKINISSQLYNLINVLFYVISFGYCIYMLIFRFWI